MYHFLLIQQGNSTNNFPFQWNKWFSLRHQDYGLDVSRHRYFDRDSDQWVYNVRIEMLRLGVPVIRAGVFELGWGGQAYPQFDEEDLSVVKEWLIDCFHFQYASEPKVMLFASATALGQPFIPVADFPDVQNWHLTQAQRVAILEQHRQNNQDVAFIDPNLYSAFNEDSLKGLNFEYPIEGE